MRTLLRATNWVGDVVMSLPALRALRRSFPSDTLAVLCRPWVADLYRLLPEVDEVLVEEPAGRHAGWKGLTALAGELSAARFERAVVLPRSFVTALTVYRAGIRERIGYRGELRGGLLTRAVPFRPAPGEHELFRHLRLVAAAGADVSAPVDTSLPVDARLKKAARALLEASGWDGGAFAAAHVASFENAAKRWDLARFGRVLDELAARHGLRVVLLGSAGERGVNADAASLCSRAAVVDLSGRSSLPEALGVLSLARLFVGNDSGIAHLAGAVGTPTVVAFGPTDPEGTRPWDGPRADGKPARIAVARARPLCAPCRFRRCPIDHRCMDALEPGAVLAAAERLLAP